MKALLLALVPSLAYADEAPAPPPPPSVVHHAAVTAERAYAEAGVVEAGGSVGVMVAPHLTDLNANVSPSIGWFLGDNVELSGIVGVTHVSAGDRSATIWTALAEPSYHLALNPTTFGFLGMGFGAAYVNKLGGGLTFAPRIGVNFLVGHAGILTPSLSYQYMTHNINAATSGPMQETSTVEVSSALRLNIGYTVMW